MKKPKVIHQCVCMCMSSRHAYRCLFVSTDQISNDTHVLYYERKLIKRVTWHWKQCEWQCCSRGTADDTRNHSLRLHETKHSVRPLTFIKCNFASSYQYNATDIYNFMTLLSHSKRHLERNLSVSPSPCAPLLVDNQMQLLYVIFGYVWCWYRLWNNTPCHLLTLSDNHLQQLENLCIVKMWRISVSSYWKSLHRNGSY